MQVQKHWYGLTAASLFLEGLCGAMILFGLVLASRAAVFLGALAGVLAGLVLLFEARNPQRTVFLLSGWRKAWISRGSARFAHPLSRDAAGFLQRHPVLA
ncbi:MAG: hypothetical protein HYY09_06785 [Firmicutes bacterium]|nr:hypothetical protein [Bacillota bacterium]